MPQTKSQVLQETYLSVRAKLLEVAATLDRIDRAKDDDTKIDEDLRFVKLRQGIHLLLAEPGPADDTRAELMQLLFSRSYEEDWPTKFELKLQR
jgi:hypothetical protein